MVNSPTTDARQAMLDGANQPIKTNMTHSGSGGYEYPALPDDPAEIVGAGSTISENANTKS